MKFLSDQEYFNLKEKANNPPEVRTLNIKLNEERAERRKEIEELTKNKNKEIEDLKKDQEIILKRKELEIDVKVAEQTKELTTKVGTLTIENGNYKKETEILTNAFKNLGFDVKDMKDILNKLVDGVVSKNQIQLIGHK